jgi:hypothetical protein
MTSSRGLSQKVFFMAVLSPTMHSPFRNSVICTFLMELHLKQNHRFLDKDEHSF